MINDRLIRSVANKGQERSPVQRKAPVLSDMVEGVPVYALTSKGFIEYVKYNNRMYEKKFIETNTKGSIHDITDNTGGNASNTIAGAASANPTAAEFENAVASLAYKINQIIKKVF